MNGCLEPPIYDVGIWCTASGDRRDGGTVGHPAAVKAVGDADGQADGRDRIAAEVTRVEDYDVAPVAVGIVDVGQDPAVVLGAARRRATKTGSSVTRPGP